ncbi:MAG: DegT/DnrJ/EryC1/StrS family aminotransferase [Verrucomicrobiota bacterium]|nr:DegT/DnrJ/EryC1/StrS family aminotransferase [Verrucomicrobiota bacterium]
MNQRSQERLALTGGVPVRERPFPAWPVHDHREAEALVETLDDPKWGIDSPRVERFESEFAAFQGAPYAVSCANGTVALEIALAALGIGPGDEVILPAYTFVATATAVVMAGATPIFADIEAQTYNMDPGHVAALITPRTRAILPVHFAGASADMDQILALAERHGLAVLEDAAQAVCSEWSGRRVGSLGEVGTFSFQSSKNMTAGEGGMVVTASEEAYRRVRSYQNCGRMIGGEWYRHYVPASNHRISAFQAAVLSVQLTRVEEQTARREASAAYLAERIKGEVPGLGVMSYPEQVTRNACHLFLMRYDPEEWNGIPKSRFITGLRAEGIPCSPGYMLPLYEQDLFALDRVRQRPGRFGEAWRTVDYRADRLPNTERACYQEAIWLPQFVLLGERADMDTIVVAMLKLRGRMDELAAASD